MLANDGNGLRRCDVVTWSPVCFSRDGVEEFLDNLFSTREPVASAHLKQLWQIELVVVWGEFERVWLRCEQNNFGDPQINCCVEPTAPQLPIAPFLDSFWLPQIRTGLGFRHKCVPRIYPGLKRDYSSRSNRAGSMDRDCRAGSHVASSPSKVIVRIVPANTHGSRGVAS